MVTPGAGAAGRDAGCRPRREVDLYLGATTDPETGRFLAEQAPLLRFLCRAEALHLGAAARRARGSDLVGGRRDRRRAAARGGAGAGRGGARGGWPRSWRSSTAEIAPRRGAARRRGLPRQGAGRRWSRAAARRLAEMRERRERILATLEPSDAALSGPGHGLRAATSEELLARRPRRRAAPENLVVLRARRLDQRARPAHRRRVRERGRSGSAGC